MKWTEVLQLVSTVGTVLVAIIGAIFGKQALAAKDAQLAAKSDQNSTLEKMIQAKEAEKAAEIKALQTEVELYKQFTPMSFVERLKSLKQLAEGEAEERKREKEASDQQVAALQAELTAAREAAGPKERGPTLQERVEALRTAEGRTQELEAEVVQLQTVAAASGTVAEFIDARPDYRELVAEHLRKLPSRFTRDDIHRIIKALEGDDRFKQSPEKDSAIQSLKKFLADFAEAHRRCLPSISPSKGYSPSLHDEKPHRSPNRQGRRGPR